ncbi:hypothetical protein Mnod_6384 [Methylobacterium nodulans ORS 2060]|uniref:Uncharacterized protein n=1 Tax=Methylobacterium nodulans (strain LMG 21967 / CNCM I-2342 / ORS 2060) TaxID=460265 RepID=B8IBY7_METNO|nr:hypothetical protein Mnod_6384 [Methylobacterium nodulans ORS 2060]
MRLKLKHLDTFVDRHGHPRFYVKLNKVRYPLPDPGDRPEPNHTFWDDTGRSHGSSAPRPEARPSSRWG